MVTLKKAYLSLQEDSKVTADPEVALAHRLFRYHEGSFFSTVTTEKKNKWKQYH